MCSNQRCQEGKVYYPDSVLPVVWEACPECADLCPECEGSCRQANREPCDVCSANGVVAKGVAA